jgi:tryptophan 2,3-dioxygenase
MSELSYTTYLNLDELLALQQPQSDGPKHDELLFIVTHQVYELWFKVLLHELDHLQDEFRKSNVGAALETLKRILRIFRTLTAQVDVLETMTPRGFLAFRGSLGSASGFQSAQFRELEFVLGHKRRSILQLFPEGTDDRRRLEQRYHQDVIWDSFLHLVARSGYPVPRSLLRRDVTQPWPSSPLVRRLLVEIYESDLTLTQVCESLMDLDECLQEWRYRHVKMVERTLGTKEGTGGSTGAEYLKRSLFQPLFPDLWAIRGDLPQKD